MTEPLRYEPVKYSYPGRVFVKQAKALTRLMIRAYQGSYTGEMFTALHLIKLIRVDLDGWQEDLLLALARLPRHLLEEQLQEMTELCEGLPEADRADCLELVETVKELVNDD